MRKRYIIMLAMVIVFYAMIGIYVTIDSKRVEAEVEQVKQNEQIEITRPEPMKIVPVDIIEPTTTEESEPELISLGNFKLTAYCPCEQCCGQWAANRPDGIVYGASGMQLISGYSVGVDPSFIPYGTILTIDGKEYIAADTGGAVKNNVIDIYFDSHEQALNFGVHYADVYVVDGGDHCGP